MQRLFELLRGIQALVGLAFLAVALVLLFLAWRGPGIERGSVLVMDVQGTSAEAAALAGAAVPPGRPALVPPVAIEIR